MMMKKTPSVKKKRLSSGMELPRISVLIRDWAKYKNTSLHKLSLQMGKSRNYLIQNLRSNDIRPSVLIELSGWLQTNLFDYYLPLLPHNLRPTRRETELQKEIDTLQKEIETLKAERDKYWEALSK